MVRGQVVATDDDDRPMQAAVRWTLGCLVAAAALVGVLVLVLLMVVVLQPPPWVQVLIGVGLAGGGVILAWLVATGLGRSRSDR